MKYPCDPNESFEVNDYGIARNPHDWLSLGRMVRVSEVTDRPATEAGRWLKVELTLDNGAISRGALRTAYLEKVRTH